MALIAYRLASVPQSTPLSLTKTVPNIPSILSLYSLPNNSVAMVDSLQTFRVRIGDACNQFDEVSVLIDTPTTDTTPTVSFLPKITPSPGGFVVRYVPKVPGTFMIRVLLNSINIYGSPFCIECLPVPILPPVCDEDPALLVSEQQASLVRAFGPGIQELCMINRIAEFIIDLKPVLKEQETETIINNPVKVIVEGPCEARIHCKNNEDGTCSVAYLPTQPGTYYVTVLYKGHHIYQSPFWVHVQPELVEKPITPTDQLDNDVTFASRTSPKRTSFRKR